MTTINKVNEILESQISEEEYDTVGGLVFGELGHVPAVGEFITQQQWRFRVEELDGRRIQTVRISLTT